MTSSAPHLVVLPNDDTPVSVAAEMYAELGFNVLPLHGVVDGRCTCGLASCEPRSAGKHPVRSQWQRHASSDLDVVREIFRSHRWNIGIMLGDRYCVVDVDGDEGFLSLSKLGDLPSTLTSKSGSGVGEHRIFAYAPHHSPSLVSNRRIAPGLDIKTRAGQIVVAPSLHRSGRQYEWVTRVMPATLPDHLYERITSRPSAAPVVPLHPPTRTGDLYKRAQSYVAKMPPAISGSGGHVATFNVARVLVGWVQKGLAVGDGWALFSDYNQTCQPPWSERELKHKWDDAMQRATAIPSFDDRDPAHASSYHADYPTPGDDHDIDYPTDDDPPAPPPPPAKREPTWQERLLWETSKTGVTKVVKHPENAIVITRFHPAWAGKLRLDTFAQAITVTDPPWHDSDRPAGLTQGASAVWTDADTVRLSAWIRRELGADLSPDVCDRAVQVAAEAAPYHPVRSYLESLQWDGKLRLADAPRVYLGAEDVPLSRLALRWWMIAAVARAYEPGCKADNVLILEGSQGLRKSSALRALASPSWFTDTPIDLHNKDAYLAIQGRWIVELAELESLRGADSSRAKAFFSSPSDTFRPPYGRRMVTVERCCVFAGTCNDATYLRDSTGNRRYWPIACSAIDVDAIARDRDQLWAEAREAYLSGAKWWPYTSDEIAAAESSQDQRSEVDAWEDVVSRHLSRNQDEEPTLGDLLTRVLDIPSGQWGRSEQIRLATILQRLGWKRFQRREGTVRTWRYRRAS
jgi:hypothetical protein